MDDMGFETEAEFTNYFEGLLRACDSQGMQRGFNRAMEVFKSSKNLSLIEKRLGNLKVQIDCEVAEDKYSDDMMYTA